MYDLNRNEAYLGFEEHSSFQEFLEEMNNEDTWFLANTQEMKVSYKTPGDIPEYIYEGATATQTDEAYANGFYAVDIKGKHYILNPLSHFTLLDRAGATSRYSKDVSEKDPERLAELYNVTLPYWAKDCMILMRGGQILAAHSENYKTLQQKDVFGISQNLMIQKFPKAKFMNAAYTHSQSEMTFSLCDQKDMILNEYAASWVNAGYSKDALEKTYPMFTVKTSDVGLFCVEIHPQLYSAACCYPLGEPIKIKHHGTASVKEIDVKMNMAYAGLTKGLDTISNMLKIELDHPVEAFTGACKAVGLHKFCKKLVKLMIEEFEYSFSYGETVTAFAAYQRICEIKYTKEYKDMSSSMKLKTDESIYRLLQVDWLSVDRPGITL